MLDPNFARSVVLLIEHSEEGALGVVLNHPAENTVKELWDEVSQGDCESLEQVNMGGPVSGPLIVLHTDESASEMKILPGLYFSAARENLEKIVTQTARPFRVFVGHSGWGGGQLEDELEEGSWLTAPAKADHVFHDDRDIWKEITHQIGESILTSALKIKNVPIDPSVN